jgi:hypothetical protein
MDAAISTAFEKAAYGVPILARIGTAPAQTLVHSEIVVTRPYTITPDALDQRK